LTTWIYVRWANTYFDARVAELRSIAGAKDRVR
jgi:hypothetical protein